MTQYGVGVQDFYSSPTSHPILSGAVTSFAVRTHNPPATHVYVSYPFISLLFFLPPHATQRVMSARARTLLNSLSTAWSVLISIFFRTRPRKIRREAGAIQTGSALHSGLRTVEMVDARRLPGHRRSHRDALRRIGGTWTEPVR